MQQQLKQCMVSVQGQPKNMHRLENVKWLYRVNKNKKHTGIREIRDDNWLVRVKFKIWQNIHILRWLWFQCELIYLVFVFAYRVVYRPDWSRQVMCWMMKSWPSTLSCTVDWHKIWMRDKKIVLKQAICHLRSRLKWTFLITCCLL